MAKKGRKKSGKINVNWQKMTEKSKKLMKKQVKKYGEKSEKREKIDVKTTNEMSKN